MVAAMGLMPLPDAVPDPSVTLAVGAPVVDAAGTALGKVQEATPDGLVVTQGTLFVTTIVVPYAAVARVEDGTVLLAWTKQQLTAAE